MKTLILTLIFVSCTSIMMSQVHLTAGITDVANRLDGNTLTFDVGYSYVFNGHETSFGVKGNYRRTSIKGLNFNSYDIVPFYQLIDNSVRTNIGIGLSYNEVDNEVDPAIYVRAAVRITPESHITLDLTNIAAEKNITHLTIGVLLDFEFKRRNKPIRFF